MADRIGVSRQAVSKWETDASAPDAFNLIELAKILDTSVEYIVTGSTEGLIPVCVMAVSAVVMAACGLIATKAHVRWMNDYALPISLIAGMASAIPFTSLLGG